MKHQKILAATFALAASMSANSYVLDETTKVVSDVASNTEWLQWTETNGMSISTALSTYGDDGWRLAGNEEMASMLDNFLPSKVWGADEAVRQTFIGTGGDGVDGAFLIGSLFGWTSIENDINVLNGLESSQVFDGMYVTNVLFGSDADNDLRFNRAYFRSEYRFDEEVTPRAEVAEIEPDSFSPWILL